MMRPSIPFIRIYRPACALLVLLAIGVCSCTTQNPAEEINKFAQATTAVSGQTENAYQAVQSNYLQAEIARMVANYDKDGFQPELLKPFLSSQELQVRIDVLTGLSTYAQGLASLASNQQLTEFDSNAKSLGQQLISLDKQKPIKATGISSTEMAGFATAVDALGRLFIDYKKQEALKQVIQDHNDDIQKICHLFSKELGGAAPADGVPPRGLRNQLWNEYTQTMTSYNQVILHNWKQMTAAEKFSAISQLAGMIQQQAASDAMLMATAKALDQLAATHNNLLQAFENPNGGIEAMIAQLQADAKNAADFYGSLQSSKK